MRMSITELRQETITVQEGLLFPSHFDQDVVIWGSFQDTFLNLTDLKWTRREEEKGEGTRGGKGGSG